MHQCNQGWDIGFIIPGRRLKAVLLLWLTEMDDLLLRMDMLLSSLPYN